MPNGERIQFGPNVNFIFETHNLKFASPATISRMGMIYLSDETVDVRALVTAWLKKLPEESRSQTAEWMDALFYKSLDWILDENFNGIVVTISRVGLALNGLSLLDKADTKAGFVNNLVRGFSANLSDEFRPLFAKKVYSWAGEKSLDPKKLMNYYVNQKGQYTEYELSLPRNLENSSISDPDNLPVVETTDVQQNLSVLQPWLKKGESIILVGKEGSGKHTLMRYALAQERSLSVVTIHCSSQTRSAHLLRRIQQACIGISTNTGRVLRPKDSERLVIYLKDINLPAPDSYETVELVQFLQQLLIYRGFYDSSLEWVVCFCYTYIYIHRLGTRKCSNSVYNESAVDFRATCAFSQIHVGYPPILLATYLSRSASNNIPNAFAADNTVLFE